MRTSVKLTGKFIRVHADEKPDVFKIDRTTLIEKPVYEYTKGFSSEVGASGYYAVRLRGSWQIVKVGYVKKRYFIVLLRGEVPPEVTSEEGTPVLIHIGEEIYEILGMENGGIVFINSKEVLLQPDTSIEGFVDVRETNKDNDFLVKNKIVTTKIKQNPIKVSVK